jgi:hypothetical protein
MRWLSCQSRNSLIGRSRGSARREFQVLPAHGPGAGQDEAGVRFNQAVAVDPPTNVAAVIPIPSHRNIPPKGEAGAVRAELYKSFRCAEVATGVTELDYPTFGPPPVGFWPGPVLLAGAWPVQNASRARGRWPEPAVSGGSKPNMPLTSCQPTRRRIAGCGGAVTVLVTMPSTGASEDTLPITALLPVNTSEIAQARRRGEQVALTPAVPAKPKAASELSDPPSSDASENVQCQTQTLTCGHGTSSSQVTPARLQPDLSVWLPICLA